MLHYTNHQKVSRRCPEGVPDVSRTCPEGVPDVPRTCPECVPNVSRTCPERAKSNRKSSFHMLAVKLFTHGQLSSNSLVCDTILLRIPTRWGAIPNIFASRHNPAVTQANQKAIHGNPGSLARFQHHVQQSRCQLLNVTRTTGFVEEY